ncbi:10442_t:CDS:2 [Entrophospora sp. SA101]|nr:10442_t:CDS:2 [Entrophospora sp. SA101]
MIVIEFCRTLATISNQKKNNDLSGTLSSPPKEIDEDEDDEIEFEDSVIKFGSNYNEGENQHFGGKEDIEIINTSLPSPSIINEENHDANFLEEFACGTI